MQVLPGDMHRTCFSALNTTLEDLQWKCTKVFSLHQKLTGRLAKVGGHVRTSEAGKEIY